ncbi:MAG: hypothetical protein ACP5NA_01080 [Candidatus Acidulodesulfobacterium sp.]
MNEINGSDFHSDFDKIFESGRNKNNLELNPYFKIGVFVFLIIVLWMFIIYLYVSYVSRTSKYEKALENINYKLKNDSIKLKKLNDNLIFFKKVAENQVNVSYILYLLSLHRFGESGIRSISVNKGKVGISVFLLEKGFARSLNLMNDYAIYLNIYDMKMHTGRFYLNAIKSKNKETIGVLSSKRFF